MVHVSSNSPFGTNPHPSDTLPGRRAVQPLLRLRPLEDAGRAGRSWAQSSAASTQRSCAHRGSTARSSHRGRRRSSAWCEPASSRSSAMASSAGRWCTSTTSSTGSDRGRADARARRARDTGLPMRGRTPSTRSSRPSGARSPTKGFSVKPPSRRLPAVAGASPSSATVSSSVSGATSNSSTCSAR